MRERDIYRIINLTAENIKRLKAVSITPDPDEEMVIIGGKNNAGKTTVLDSIEYILMGKVSICDDPIRHGQRKGKITVDLDKITPVEEEDDDGLPSFDPVKTNLLVTRTFTKSGSELIIKNKKGVKLTAPQTALNGIAGDLTFDPMRFISMERREQAEVLRRLVGINTVDHDKKRKEVESERTVIGRMAKEKRAAYNQSEGQIVGERPAERVDMNALGRERMKAMEINGERKRLREDIKRWAEEMVDDEADIVELQRRVAAKIEARDSAAVKLDKMHPVDIEPIQEQLNNAENINRIHDQYAALDKYEQSASQAEGEYVAMTKQLKTLDEEKARMLSSAKFPVPGLSIEEEVVTYNGVPLDQAGSAEQLRVSAAIGCAQHPQLRLMLIRDGSLMDDESIAALRVILKERKMQAWVEMVGENDGMSVIIEEGEVKARKKKGKKS